MPFFNKLHFRFMKIKIATLIFFPVAFLAMISSTRLDPNNPPTGRTGAPGETTCQASGCHSGGNFSGSVTISGVPDTVVADESYNITLTNTSNANRAGFQLTVLDENNTKTGTLTAGTGCSIGNSGGRQYVRQSTPKNLSNGNTSWSFTWKAPATVANDSIHFYFVSLCANGNGNDNGDNVLVSSRSVVLPTPVSAVNDANQQIKFEIYPNPVGQELNLDLPGEKTVSILDAEGKLIEKYQRSTSTKLNLAGLAPGLYFIRIDQKGKTGSQVFVKN